jgi:hypothetical protein
MSLLAVTLVASAAHSHTCYMGIAYIRPPMLLSISSSVMLLLYCYVAGAA